MSKARARSNSNAPPAACARCRARIGGDPIPAAGALGYFEWEESGALAEPLPWMRAWGGAVEGGLFGDLPVQYETPPRKPFGTTGKDPKRRR
jgi:hypothetical protein